MPQSQNDKCKLLQTRVDYSENRRDLNDMAQVQKQRFNIDIT